MEGLGEVRTCLPCLQNVLEMTSLKPAMSRLMTSHTLTTDKPCCPHIAFGDVASRSRARALGKDPVPGRYTSVLCEALAELQMPVEALSLPWPHGQCQI